ncbi:MAG: 2Fe-2S iron-sulfur cluster binding protein, partial [Rhizobacter sp.]|nr:2Fe-2S iron-sulfur cluster binding protein [Rhizobacter sp.]
MTPHEAVQSHGPTDGGSDSRDPADSQWHLTRREAVKAGAALGAIGVVGSVHAQAGGAPVTPAGATTASTTGVTLPPQTMPVTLDINGQKRQLMLDTRTTLLDALRENLQLTGSKKGCDHGQCGACTVLIDGRRTNSCLTLAVMHDGQAITTIEGLSTGPVGQEKLHPIQEAFLKHDGFQCGYCTPGQICSTAGML